MALLTLPTIDLAGTAAEMGLAYGRACAGPARAFVDQRERAGAAYLRERGVRDRGQLRRLASECLALLRSWHADGWSELVATAEGAGLAPEALFAAANYTDLRDCLTWPQGGRAAADAEGCTAVLLPPAATRDGEVIAAQTWDLNPSDLDFVVAVHRRPADGRPATWSITCAGCPSLIGMTADGLAVGTTNIKTRGARPGIAYLSLLHRALASRSRAEAVASIIGAPRAAAHSYWLADRQGAEDLECSPERAVRRQAATPLARTNHCLDAEHQAREGEPPSRSSLRRLARAAELASAGAADLPALQRLFSDRADGVDSICRYAEDGQGTSTNACIVALPARRELHACRGAADRGAWVRLGFDG
jgi:isopenicillin-N N-acyltransferase-like protein